MSAPKLPPSFVQLSESVADAKRLGRPILGFESTIFSELGLPLPHNLECLDRCLDAADAYGVTPALTAVLDGVAWAGVERSDAAIICGPAKKAAARDLSVAIGQAWPYGATTVSASLEICAAAGIEVFATGGIGGVHRGWAATGDISADLEALARHQVVTVSAGAKVFLDLPATLERLETDSVPVLGWQCDEVPGLSRPVKWPSRCPPGGDRRRSGSNRSSPLGPWPGRATGCGPGSRDRRPPARRARTGRRTRPRRRRRGRRNRQRHHPVVLGALADATDGRSIPTNLALAENNARVGAQIAVALAP
ncbi:MAG: pseudouridine-5'-phosphate glycosidase [Acidimicrobiales bacterium]